MTHASVRTATSIAGFRLLNSKYLQGTISGIWDTVDDAGLAQSLPAHNSNCSDPLSLTIQPRFAAAAFRVPRFRLSMGENFRCWTITWAEAKLT